MLFVGRVWSLVVLCTIFVLIQPTTSATPADCGCTYFSASFTYISDYFPQLTALIGVILAWCGVLRVVFYWKRDVVCVLLALFIVMLMYRYFIYCYNQWYRGVC